MRVLRLLAGEKPVDAAASFRPPSISEHAIRYHQAGANAADWRVLAPFHSREYRLLIAAVSLSIFAEGMWAVVMELQVIELSNDRRRCRWSPRFGYGTGRVPARRRLAADRINQRSIIVAVELVNTAVVIGRSPVRGSCWRAAHLAYGRGRRHWDRRGVLLPGLQRALLTRILPPVQTAGQPTVWRVSSARSSSEPSPWPSPASWWRDVSRARCDRGGLCCSRSA